MKYIKAVVINDAKELEVMPLQRGQWIKLAWLDRPSRFHSVRASGSIWATHAPKAGAQFNKLCSLLATRDNIDRCAH